MGRIEPPVTVEQPPEESVYSADIDRTQQTGKARQPPKEQGRGALVLVGIGSFSSGVLPSTF